MSERDVPPPTGPLARLRAQLAGPRGYRRIESLLAAEDAHAAVAALSPNEIFELVHEVGWEDAQALMEYVTPAQIQGCFDLDGWNKDQLEVASLKPWIVALTEVGYEKVGEAFAALDTELRALILQQQVHVYDTTMNEGPEEDNDEPIMPTPDGFFLLELKSEDDDMRAVIQRLVEDLYRADADLARHMIMSARSEPPAELEEMSYRWRSGRLADLGYVDFYEALDLFRPLPVDQVNIGEGSQDRTIEESTAQMPIVIAEEVIGRSFLARALAAIDNPEEAERLEAAILVLVNKVLAAGRAKPGQPEVVRRGALYATATLSLGLEVISRSDLTRGQEALRTIALGRLFRVGYTVTLRLAKLAVALAPRSLTAGPPAKDLVAGLCSPRPLFSRAADEPGIPGLRPFESQADLRRAGEILTGLTIRIALVEGLGVDVVAMGTAPEPRPDLDDHIRTALARVLAAPHHVGELRGDALSQAELTQLRSTAFSGGKLTAAARRAGHLAIETRLGAAQLTASGPVLAKLIDGWLDDLERILGTIKDAEVDARYVEGLLVEVNRS